MGCASSTCAFILVVKNQHVTETIREIIKTKQVFLLCKKEKENGRETKANYVRKNLSCVIKSSFTEALLNELNEATLAILHPSNLTFVLKVR